MAIGGKVPIGFYGEYQGAYRILGTVTELGIAGSYRVVLYRRNTFKAWRTQVSMADGTYLFSFLPYFENGYFVIAFDHGDNPLNAAIADLITPEPMP